MAPKAFGHSFRLGEETRGSDLERRTNERSVARLVFRGRKPEPVELGRILLTGDSSRLRAFVARLSVDAFDRGFTLTRVKEETGRVAAPRDLDDARFHNPKKDIRRLRRK